jgi:Heterokaryon incompatibility protein (HET)
MSPSFLRYVDTAGDAQPTEGHRACTADVCKRNQVDPDTYSQQHWQPKCRCRFVKPSSEQVFEILDAGKIPVVQFCDQEATFELRAINPDNTKSDYIAFSHVWADGLGSCTEKGLPTCQVRRLERLSQNRDTYESWFWIDGLCVPKAEPYRGKAIQLMKKTYHSATGVVVLDSSLRQVSISSSLIEIGWTLLASGWMGRLWTYQEGFLPPWVDLELSDGFYDLYSLIQNLYKAYYEHSSSPFPFLFTRDLLASLQKTRPLGLKHYTRTKSRQIVDTFNVLTRRLTSRTDDQLLVLGLLLDVDVERLMTLSGEDRWKEFYLSLREVPWTIIFDRRPKMCSANFRWAPKTWISHGKDEWLHYDDGLAVCSNNGLQVNITALVLDDLCALDQSQILIQVDEDLYELSRSPSSPVIGPTAVNLIFVRHLKHETPRASLYRNSLVLMRVGVGFFSQTAADQLQYDFAAGWDIRLLEELTEEQLPAGKSVTGRWEQREFYFT